MAIHYVHPVHRELARACPAWPARESGAASAPTHIAHIEVDLAAATQEAWDKGLEGEFPWRLPNDDLLILFWDGGPGCSGSNSFNACTHPSGVRVYFGHGDWQERPRALAAFAGDFARGDADFLRELVSSNGEAYGTNVMCGPPSDVSLSSVLPVGEWRELLLACCEVAAGANDSFWEEVPTVTSEGDTRIACSHPADRGCDEDWCDERCERAREVNLGDWITRIAEAVRGGGGAR